MRLNTSFKATSGFIKSNTPISLDVLRSNVPSIFADDKHHSRSDRYTYVPTSDIVVALDKEGFRPFFACQAKVRSENVDRADFAKHMIRFRHASTINSDVANEIILVNSHDGSTSYQMMAGAFRFVCTNGLICGDLVDDIRVRHSGNIVDNVIEGAYSILDQFGNVEASKEGMKSIVLKPEEKRIFADVALTLKYEDKAPIASDALLNAHRREDKEDPSLWSTFNTVQENLIRGGQYGRTANNRNTRTRAVNGIGQNVQLNQALWTLAEKMKELKAA
jgi:hypothetical protein